MIIKRIKEKLRKKVVKKTFQKNACADASTVFLPGASCRNSGQSTSVTIGPHCTFGASIITLFGGCVHIGENTYIGQGSSLQAKERIQIGSNVIIANDALLIDNNNHPIDPQMRLKMSACADYMSDHLWSWEYAESAPIIIEDNVWIGRDARILKGVTVGKGSIVALGAIVTHDVPPYCIVAGNPAKVVKELPKPGETE